MKTDWNRMKVTPENLVAYIGTDKGITMEEAVELLTFLRKIAHITVKRYLEQ